MSESKRTTRSSTAAKATAPPAATSPSDIINLLVDKSYLEKLFRAHPEKVDAVLSAMFAAAEPFMESDDDDDDDEDLSWKEAAPHILATLKKGEDAQQKNAELLYDLQDKVHELQGIRNE